MSISFPSVFISGSDKRAMDMSLDMISIGDEKCKINYGSLFDFGNTNDD